jgi:hypothetical protein
LSFKSFLPFSAPPSWYFTDPDTGHVFGAESKRELIEKILAYREQNELPEIFQLGHVIDNFLCNQPENIGRCGKNMRLDRSWWTTLKGGVALLVNLLCKNPVSQEEADRRAFICLGCKYNVFPDKGRFVKWSDRIAESTVPGKRSVHHNQLGNCEVCTCVLKAKVFMPGPFDLSEEEKSKMREVGCWQVSKGER